MTAATVIDLDTASVRDLNAALHALAGTSNLAPVHVRNPRGRHALAVGVDVPVDILLDGPVGYYAGGMNDGARIVIAGNAATGVAENMMSGSVRVHGDASQSAGATAHGGLLVIEGNAGARCGISMKGVDIVVGGSVGHMSAFMAQSGTLVVCGDAGEALGDSIYEARLFVRGAVRSLGADCEEKPMGAAERALVASLLDRAGMAGIDAASFRCFGSARRLYHFHVDNAQAY